MSTEPQHLRRVQLNTAALARARAARLGHRGVPPIDAAASRPKAEELQAQFSVRRTEVTPRLNPTPAQLAQTPRTQDYTRLSARLAQFGLIERPITDDANSQFRAIADQLYGSEEPHMLVRAMAVEQLLIAPELYVEFVSAQDEAYNDYVDRMGKEGELGDHVTLQALADYLHLEITLVTSSDEDGLMTVMPAAVAPAEDDFPTAPLWLSMWADVNYKSLSM